MSIVEGMTSIGVEVIQNQAVLQLLRELNSAIERQEAAWLEPDKQIAGATKQPFYRTRLEPIKPENVYPGARLGILGMPWDRFPALSVMVDTASPSPESISFDQSTHAYTPQLYVECVLRSETFWKAGTNEYDPAERIYQEGLLDRRSKRTLEAIVEAIGRDLTLGGMIPELTAPQVSQTDAFSIDGEEPGEQYKQRIFSLIRVLYSPETYATRFGAGQPDAAVLPMDFPR